MRVGFKHFAKPSYISHAGKSRMKTMEDATVSRQDAITEDEISGTAVPASSASAGNEHPTPKTSNACK